MTHRIPPLGLAVLLAISFSSCTCSSSTPAPPAAPTARPSGFSVVKPTARQAPPPAEGVVAPEDATPREAPTPPPTQVEAKLPEDFPEDVPVFEGAEVAAVQQLPNKANNVIFTADAETPKIFKFYKEDMRGSGWAVAQEYEGKEQSFLSFTKDNVITNVSVSKDPKTGKKVIAVMYYKEEPLPFPEF
jgi:hypothetical protein